MIPQALLDGEWTVDDVLYLDFLSETTEAALHALPFDAQISEVWDDLPAEVQEDIRGAL